MAKEFLPSIFTHPVGNPELGLLGDAVDEETYRRQQQGSGNKFVDTSANHWQFGPPAQARPEPGQPDAEYYRLSRQVDELGETRGVNAPEYQEAFRRLVEKQRQLGLENDPGIEEGDATQESPQQYQRDDVERYCMDPGSPNYKKPGVCPGKGPQGGIPGPGALHVGGVQGGVDPAAAVRKVASLMGSGLLRRFEGAVGQVQFHPTLASVRGVGGEGEGGAFVPGGPKGTLHVTSGQDAGWTQGQVENAAAHNIGLAVDSGPPRGMRLSGQPFWKRAWEREIAAPSAPLSQAALQSPRAGFAEFFRLALMDTRAAARHFPLSWHFLSQYNR